MTMFILLCLIAVCMCVATAGAVRAECDRTITVSMGFGLMSCAVSVTWVKIYKFLQKSLGDKDFQHRFRTANVLKPKC